MGNSRAGLPGRRPAGRLAGVAVALSLALGGVTGCNFVGDKSAPATAATVEGMEISSESVDELFEIFRKTEAGKEKDQGGNAALVSDKVIRQVALSYQIKITFLEALAKKEGITIDDTQDEEGLFDDLVNAPSFAGQGVRPQDLRIAARAEKLQKAIAAKLLPNVEVNDDELADAFEQRKEALGESFKAETDIAFMNTKEAAEELIEKTKKGDKFLDTANATEDKLLVDTVTINPLSPISGDFIAKVKDLKQGELSEPLEFTVDDGTLYVVLHVEKREDLKALSVEDQEVKEELSEIVRNSKRFQFFDKWFNKRFREAKIDVDSYYGEWTPRSLAVT